MTLIITASSDDVIVQVTDRRLTNSDGSLFDDLAIKSICVGCADAVFSVAYTGLALVGQTRTDELIIDYLASIKAGEMAFVPLVESLQRYLSSTFRPLRPLGKRRGVTLALAGFSPRGPFLGLLSNMEDEKGNWLDNIDDDFRLGFFFRNNKPLHRLDVMLNGAEAAADVFEQHLPSVTKRYFRKSPNEISKAIVHLIRRASRHPKVGHLIGRNCISTIVGPDGNFICDDFPENESPRHNSPHLISGNFAYKGIEVWTGDGPPLWWEGKNK